MVDRFFIQIIGVILATAGLVALMVSAHLFGTPPSPAEKRRASDEWNRRRDTSRLLITPEVILSTIVLLGGIGILIWTGFDLCAFLAYWFPPLPGAIRLLLSCR